MKSIIKGISSTAILLLFSIKPVTAALLPLADAGFDNNPALVELTLSANPPTGTWLSEGNGTGASITTAVGGVTPFLTDAPSTTARMLQLNQIGGGATQVQQYIPYAGIGGEEISFSALFNDLTAGASGSVSMRTKSSVLKAESSTRMGSLPCNSGIRSEGLDR